MIQNSMVMCAVAALGFLNMFYSGARNPMDNMTCTVCAGDHGSPDIYMYVCM